MHGFIFIIELRLGLGLGYLRPLTSIHEMISRKEKGKFERELEKGDYIHPPTHFWEIGGGHKARNTLEKVRFRSLTSLILCEASFSSFPIINYLFLNKLIQFIQASILMYEFMFLNQTNIKVFYERMVNV